MYVCMYSNENVNGSIITQDLQLQTLHKYVDTYCIVGYFKGENFHDFCVWTQFSSENSFIYSLIRVKIKLL